MRALEGNQVRRVLRPLQDGTTLEAENGCHHPHLALHRGERPQVADAQLGGRALCGIVRAGDRLLERRELLGRTLRPREVLVAALEQQLPRLLAGGEHSVVPECLPAQDVIVVVVAQHHQPGRPAGCKFRRGRPELLARLWRAVGVEYDGGATEVDRPGVAERATAWLGERGDDPFGQLDDLDVLEPRDAARIAHRDSPSSNLPAIWLPSQKGLFFDRPHRQSVTRLRTSYGSPVALTISTPPRTNSGPLH